MLQYLMIFSCISVGFYEIRVYKFLSILCREKTLKFASRKLPKNVMCQEARYLSFSTLATKAFKTFSLSVCRLFCITVRFDVNK